MTNKQIGMLITAISSLSMALGGAAGTWAAGERVQTEVSTLKARVKTIESNQRIVDLQQRQTQQQAEWANEKLDRILSSQGIEPPRKPPLPSSELQKTDQ